MLALQGDFEAHAKALERAGAEAVRGPHRRADLDGLDGLIIPGGESTTMLKLLHVERICWSRCASSGRRKPIFGTCAGAILLASEVSNPDAGEPRPDGYRRGAQRLRPSDRQPHRASAASRSGRRRSWKRSSSARPSSAGSARPRRCWRAIDGDPVLVEQGRHMVATFHPELTGDAGIHEHFLQKISEG